MRICVNGTWREVGSPVLDRVLAELGYQEQVIATAVNGQFVGANEREKIALNEGDKVEIVAPMQGG